MGKRSRLVSRMAACIAALFVACSAVASTLGSDADVFVGRAGPAPSFRVQPKFLTFSAARWKQDTLRWYYNPAYSPIATATVLAYLDAAFAKWAAVCDMKFVYGGITATPLQRNDGLLVVGWSTVLGSSSGGTWLEIVADTIVDADLGLHPFQAGSVAPLDSLLVHEIGHVLGLDHSDVAGAVMSGPPYTPYVPWAQMLALKPDDVTGCQALYGPRAGVAPTNPPQQPLCTVSVSESTPAIGKALLVSAQCSGMPYRYRWTGCGEPRGRSCIDDSTTPGARTYSVVATNAGGDSASASASATWIDTLPRCTIVQQSPSGPPTTADSLQLVAQCSNAPVRYRWIGCASSGASCTTQRPVDGVATYAVVAGNASGDGPAASVAVAWQPSTPLAPCGGFGDVAANDPFCTHVDWLANRGVTNGCAPGSFCGNDDVSRLQMAAFLSRLGASMTPTVMRAELPSATFSAGAVTCQTYDSTAPSARAAIVRMRLTASTFSGASVVRGAPVISYDAGQTWSNLALDGGTAGELVATRASTLNDYAAVDLEPGQQVRFGIRVDGATLHGSCALNAEVFNRNRNTAPF